MVPPFNRNLKPFAGALPKNMTDAEYALWSKLRRKQLSGDSHWYEEWKAPLPGGFPFFIGRSYFFAPTMS